MERGGHRWTNIQKAESAGPVTDWMWKRRRDVAGSWLKQRIQPSAKSRPSEYRALLNMDSLMTAEFAHPWEALGVELPARPLQKDLLWPSVYQHLVNTSVSDTPYFQCILNTVSCPVFSMHFSRFCCVPYAFKISLKCSL